MCIAFNLLWVCFDVSIISLNIKRASFRALEVCVNIPEIYPEHYNIGRLM